MTHFDAQKQKHLKLLLNRTLLSLFGEGSFHGYYFFEHIHTNTTYLAFLLTLSIGTFCVYGSDVTYQVIGLNLAKHSQATYKLSSIRSLF